MDIKACEQVTPGNGRWSERGRLRYPPSCSESALPADQQADWLTKDISGHWLTSEWEASSISTAKHLTGTEFPISNPFPLSTPPTLSKKIQTTLTLCKTGHWQGACSEREVSTTFHIITLHSCPLRTCGLTQSRSISPVCMEAPLCPQPPRSPALEGLPCIQSTRAALRTEFPPSPLGDVTL